MKKAAIFDMDGLLFDTEKLFQKAWNQNANAMGITLPPSFATTICGSSGALQEKIITDYMPGADPKAMIKRVNESVYAWEEEEIPIMKGAFEILTGMQEHGLILSVASSSPLPMIERNLRKAGMTDFFACLVSGTQVAHGKPAPDIFLLAAEKSNVDPADAYVFEDSINGTIAGARAGCASIMIPDIVPPNDTVRSVAAGIFPDLSAAWQAIRQGRI